VTGNPEEKIWAALSGVYDPELDIPVTDLGLIYRVTVNGTGAEIDFTLTSPGCPLGSLLESEIVKAVAPLEGIETVKANLVWTPYWGPERMNEVARLSLGYSI